MRRPAAAIVPAKTGVWSTPVGTLVEGPALVLTPVRSPTVVTASARALVTPVEGAAFVPTPIGPAVVTRPVRALVAAIEGAALITAELTTPLVTAPTRSVITPAEGPTLVPTPVRSPTVVTASARALVATVEGAALITAELTTPLVTAPTRSVITPIEGPTLVPTPVVLSPTVTPVEGPTILPTVSAVAPSMIPLVLSFAARRATALTELPVPFARTMVTTVRSTGPPVVTFAARTVLGHAFSYLNYQRCGRLRTPLWT
ncbi:hypothetical protein [Saccharomonospora cyanea]|uniref:hypothetical protein n=1 Tax=Saccharomonospora cyanea TaxID=40989 RepID=UPI001E31EF4F|nr:hypothetical protein [Saccharomonospora cyanea]